MYIDTVPNRNSPPAILLREGWRENGKVKKRTLANLSKWPKAKVATLRRLLNDEPLVGRDDAFDIVRSLPHGHVAAVLGTLHKLRLDRLIDPKRSPQRERVLAMIAARVLDPGSKLATAGGLAGNTARDTLAETLGLGGAPRMEPARGDAEHSGHRGDTGAGLIRSHELQRLAGTESASRANPSRGF